MEAKGNNFLDIQPYKGRHMGVISLILYKHREAIAIGFICKKMIDKKDFLIKILIFSKSIILLTICVKKFNYTMYGDNRKTLISMIIRNMAGVLSKISNVCSENSINIDKLTISNFKTDNYAEQRAIMSVECSNEELESLLEKLKDTGTIVRYYVYKPGNYIQRELFLLKIKADNKRIEDIIELANEYHGQNIYYVESDIMIFQFANDEEKNVEFMKKLEELTDDAEILQSGLVAVSFDDDLQN